MPTEELVTVEELKQRYVEDVIGDDDPYAVVPEIFPDAVTIRVAVTGDRPPMDYVSVGGDPIGFNTALIAEIAKKLGVNVEFVNVACAARASRSQAAFAILSSGWRSEILKIGKALRSRINRSIPL